MNAKPTNIAQLADRIFGENQGRLVVLTGAGCSTESGIPDYRGPETARRARNPIQYKGFVSDPAARERYWSRSFRGWPLIRDARPNAAHEAIARLETLGLVSEVITQNVDRLHQKAGSTAPTELHGALADVRCLGCRALVARETFQAELAAMNPVAASKVGIAMDAAPDGDADLLDGDGVGFVVPSCRACGGVMKPDVVFFGEAVPAERVARARQAVDAAGALLVVGTSLAVYSGLRFVRQAHERGLFTALVNLGPPARGADYFDFIIDGRAGRLLPQLAALGGRSKDEADAQTLAATHV